MYYNITLFEVKQLYPMGFSPTLAAIFSRGLIGVEFALGFMLLFPFNLKRIVFPATILLLGVFSVQLMYEILTVGNKGNCGCFGALLPMTPLQALIKNLVAMAVLGLGIWKFGEELSKRDNMRALIAVKLACIAALFLLIPIKSAKAIDPIQPKNDTELIDEQEEDTTQTSTPITKLDTVVKTDVPKVEENLGPKPKKSGYAKYFPKIDEGKKILCFFAPSCPHCMETAKELTAMKKADKDFPEVQIIFMDEAPEEIPGFFKFAGAEYPHVVMDIIQFWTTLGNNKDVPGVLYLWNGNTRKFYQGIGDEKFVKSDLKKQLKETK
jgi:thiol-disulfide isomerase/thioredoxin